MGYAEKEKSQASDSFKRACFNWGIGRELYSAPFIWIPAGKVEIKNKGDKCCCNERFSVSVIGCNDDREISALTIINSKGQVLYEMRAAKESDRALHSQESSRKKQEPGLSKDQMVSLVAELDRTGVEMQAVKDRFKVKKPEEMSPELYK